MLLFYNGLMYAVFAFRSVNRQGRGAGGGGVKAGRGGTVTLVWVGVTLTKASNHHFLRRGTQHTQPISYPLSVYLLGPIRHQPAGRGQQRSNPRLLPHLTATYTCTTNTGYRSAKNIPLQVLLSCSVRYGKFTHSCCCLVCIFFPCKMLAFKE